MPKKEEQKNLTIPQRKLSCEVKVGANLMKSLIKVGLPVASSCLGDGICGKCRVLLIGKANLANALEVQTLAKNNCDTNERLACQVIVVDDLVVKTSYW